MAYGKDSLHSDTRDALLYSQLYDGLRYNLMRGPAVSGSQNYRELCVAARGEEHRLAALQQRHQLKPPNETSGRLKKPDAGQTNSRGSNQDTTSSLSRKQAPSSVMSETQVICYNSGMPGHMAKNCRQKKQESKGRTPNKTGWSQTKQVLSEDQGTSQSQQDTSTPESLLYSDSDNEGAKACTVRVQDGGSISQCVKVQLQGVPAYGFIDTGADITIIGGKLFKKVATIARLKKRHFKKADKIPKTYDQKTFKLDGRMDLDITFEGRAMCMPVYIKMDAVDQLLLPEGVCRQLGMVTFHPKLEQWRGCSKKSSKSFSSSPSTQEPLTPEPTQTSATTEARVPAIRVNLVQSVHLLPHQSQVVEVSLDSQEDLQQPLLLDGTQLTCGVGAHTSLIDVDKDGRALTVLSNPTGCSMTIDEGSLLGVAVPVEPVEPKPRVLQPTESKSESGPSSDNSSH